ncbi:ABC transporter permease [Amycolatopsis sp. BJA-103]|uniref:ABC transporter permease n=1 Tax=unclassified Amycolatopsis TaxID=2618356 RepID=UPI000C7614E3|nr:ABC transporter permease [Amycolatopsis sp. BJA-103]AUI64312.1 polyamine ABC transporter permease [Amycolatopsis sp. BJA-103]PNE14951.1 polyamine ABC transporter permease [Amycolatopsis sp. BJA-103]
MADKPSISRAALRQRTLGWGLRAWVAVVGFVLVAPTLVVIPMSFGAGSTFQFPPDDWSWRWYGEFFGSKQWLAALGNSVQVGLLAAVLATVVGVAAAFGLDRARFRGRGVVRQLLMAPMILPGIVVAVAVYGVFLRWQLNGTMLGFVLAHAVLGVPFVLTSVQTSLAGYDPVVEKAAASLGAPKLTTLRKVVLPIIAPGVLSGFVFAFATSFDEVVVALFLQTPAIKTLPVKMYESIVLEIDPTIAAASSLIVVFTTILLFVPTFLRRRSHHD